VDAGGQQHLTNRVTRDCVIWRWGPIAYTHIAGALSGRQACFVLETRVGSGQNLPLYRSVDHVCAIDPSAELLRLASNRIADVPVPVSLVRGSAEQIPFGNTVFDTIVTTWTLCSIPDPVAAVVEMRPVLKPGGKFVFVEHGVSPESRIARWQHPLTPRWKRIGGGLPSRPQNG
jgi:ubiquinone/menaquinone biosynthesis C-methylase UbiE